MSIARLTSDDRFEFAKVGKLVHSSEACTVTVLAPTATSSRAHVELALSGEIEDRRSGDLESMCALATQWADLYGT